MGWTAQNIRRRMGEKKYEIAMSLLAEGHGTVEVGRVTDTDPRWISVLVKELRESPGTQPLEIVKPNKAVNDKAPKGLMARYRRLLNRNVPISTRANRYGQLAESKNPAVAARALERIDELTGFVTDKRALPDPNPPPLFLLPWDVNLNLAPLNVNPRNNALGVPDVVPGENGKEKNEG